MSGTIAHTPSSLFLQNNRITKSSPPITLKYMSTKALWPFVSDCLKSMHLFDLKDTLLNF